MNPFLFDRNEWEGLTPEQIMKRNRGLEGLPMHPDFMNVRNVQVRIYDYRLRPEILEPIKKVPADEIHAWDHSSFDYMWNFNHLWSYSITIYIEDPAIPVQALPEELDEHLDRELICRAMGVDPAYPSVMPTFMVGSDPDREPPRTDLIFSLADPVYMALTKKGRDSRQRQEISKLYLDTISELSRKIPGGGKWIGKDKLGYNAYSARLWSEGRVRTVRRQLQPLGSKNPVTGEPTERDYILKIARQMSPQGTKAIVEALKNLEPDETFPDVCRKFKKSKPYITKLARKHGIKSRAKKRQDRIMKLKAKNPTKTQQWIADRLGYDQSLVSRTLKT